MRTLAGYTADPDTKSYWRGTGIGARTVTKESRKGAAGLVREGWQLRIRREWGWECVGMPMPTPEKAAGLAQ